MICGQGNAGDESGVGEGAKGVERGAKGVGRREGAYFAVQNLPVALDAPDWSRLFCQEAVDGGADVGLAGEGLADEDGVDAG